MNCQIVMTFKCKRFTFPLLSDFEDLSLMMTGMNNIQISCTHNVELCSTDALLKVSAELLCVGVLLHVNMLSTRNCMFLMLLMTMITLAAGVVSGCNDLAVRWM